MGVELYTFRHPATKSGSSTSS